MLKQYTTFLLAFCLCICAWGQGTTPQYPGAGSSVGFSTACADNTTVYTTSDGTAGVVSGTFVGGGGLPGPCNNPAFTADIGAMFDNGVDGFDIPVELTNFEDGSYDLQVIWFPSNNNSCGCGVCFDMQLQLPGFDNTCGFAPSPDMSTFGLPTGSQNWGGGLFNALDPTVTNIIAYDDLCPNTQYDVFVYFYETTDNADVFDDLDDGVVDGFSDGDGDGCALDTDEIVSTFSASGQVDGPFTIIGPGTRDDLSISNFSASLAAGSSCDDGSVIFDVSLNYDAGCFVPAFGGHCSLGLEIEVLMNVACGADPAVTYASGPLINDPTGCYTGGSFAGQIILPNTSLCDVLACDAAANLDVYVNHTFCEAMEMNTYPTIQGGDTDVDDAFLSVSLATASGEADGAAAIAACCTPPECPVTDFTVEDACSNDQLDWLAGAACGTFDGAGVGTVIDVFIYDDGTTFEAPAAYVVDVQAPTHTQGAGTPGTELPDRNPELSIVGFDFDCVNSPSVLAPINWSCDPIVVTYFFLTFDYALDSDANLAGEYRTDCDIVRYDVTIYPEVPQLFATAGDCGVAPFIEAYSQDGTTLCDTYTGPLPAENTCSTTDTDWIVDNDNIFFGTVGSGCETQITGTITSSCENTQCCPVTDFTVEDACSNGALTWTPGGTCADFGVPGNGVVVDLFLYDDGTTFEAPVGYLVDTQAPTHTEGAGTPGTEITDRNPELITVNFDHSCTNPPNVIAPINWGCEPITVTYFLVVFNYDEDSDVDGLSEYSPDCVIERYDVVIEPEVPSLVEGFAGDCGVAPIVNVYSQDGTLCDTYEGPIPAENICSITQDDWVLDDDNIFLGTVGSGCETQITGTLSSFCENTDCCPTEVDSQFESVDVCDLGSPDPAVVAAMEAAITASLIPDPAVTGIPVTIGWLDVASNTYLSTDGIAFSSPDEFAFTNPTCDPGSLSFIPVVICQNPSTGEFTELESGLLTVTIYPVPVIAFPDLTPIPSDCDPDVTTPTDNCVTAITTNCPNAIIEYDTDGDGFTDSIFPPDPTPDGGVQTYGAIAYIEGAPLDQGCFGAQLYDTECVCDLLDVTISPIQGMNGGILPFWYNAVNVDICGGSGTYTYDWDRAGYVRVEQNNDFFDPNNPEFIIHYADEADWSLTITDEYGCDMIVTNDNAWEGGSNGVINGGPILDVCDFELTGSTGVNNEDGTLTICVEGGTAGYTLELYQGSQVSVGTYVNSMNIDDDGGVLAGAANAGDCLDCITFTDLETSHYTVLITDANGETTEDHYWLPLDRNGGRLKSDLSNSNIMVNAYPNPFAEETMIEFATDIDTDVTVNIIDVAGRIVDTAFAGFVEAGQVQFVNFDANNMANGIYICQITTENGNTATYKLVVSK